MAERTITRLLPLLALACLAVSCSTSGYDEPAAPPRGRPDFGGGNGQGRLAARGAAAGLDMLPPADWWHDATIAGPVSLSSEQLQSLDRIGQDQGETIARLERDSMVAVRDLRQQVEVDHPATADIVAAGQRLRAMRDELFDRQVRMLADERLVMTQTQWRTLQDQLQSARRGRDSDDGNSRRGRGGYPGGRRPGRPF